MASFAVDTIAFDSGDTRPVEDAMRRLTDRGDGIGWINIGPGLSDAQLARLPEPTMIGKWFSGRGPIVPMATWTPPAASERSSAPVVGIEHGVGPNALEQLHTAGASLPSGWRKVQDHAKRGIVAEVAPSAANRDVVRWLLSACWSLCGIEIDDHWLADVHQPA